MKYITHIIFFLAAISCSADEMTSDFLAQMETTERILTDVPVFDGLNKLAKLNPERAMFIAKFWKHRAVSAKSSELKQIGDLYEKMRQTVHSKMMDDADGKKAERMLKEQTDMALLSYYYDHAKEIDTMIRLSLKRAEAEKK